MASGNFISSTGTNLNLYVTWSSTTDVSSNTSVVTAKVYMRSYTISGKALTNSYITINGNKKSFAGTSLNKTSSSLTDTLLTTHSTTVSHNTDGSKSIVITANLEFNGTVSGKYLSNITASKTVGLDTIPRASSFTIPSSVNTGSNLNVSISPANSSFKHRVQLLIDGAAKYTSSFIAAGTTSFSHPIPHGWLPNHTLKVMTVRVLTYTSSEAYIAEKERTINVVVPSNIRPSVTALTPSLYGTGLDGQYIQGKSQVKLVATAKAGDGASAVISSYTFKGANISGTSSEFTGNSNTKTSSVINKSGTITYQVVVKDSRGRESEPFSTSIKVHTYATPQVKLISAQRCLADGKLDTNGTCAKVTVKISYVSIDGHNKVTLKLFNSKDNYTVAKTVIDANNTEDTYTGVYGGDFENNQSYTIRATITDSMGGKHNKTTTLQVSERTINIAKHGNGVAIGGLSTVERPTDENNLPKFECNWDAYFNDSLFVTNKITCNNPYDARNFNINCYWKDGSTHDILVRSNDGLTTGLGWVGSDDYPTVLDLRPTKVKVRGTTDFYVGNTLTFETDKDDQSEYIRSVPTYNRTYDASPNVYITSLGTFGRGTSSSQRYKTDIENVKDDTLNPYNILSIPVRQFKYNKDNVPVNKCVDDLYIGLIAEEVEKEYPAAAEYNEDGQVEMWNIKAIVPAMLKILQDQQKIIDELKQKVDDLEMNTPL